MKTKRSYLILLLIVPAILLFVSSNPPTAEAQQTENPLITGTIHDSQNQPVAGAIVSLSAAGNDDSISEGETQPNGRYALSLPNQLPRELVLHFERDHFKPVSMELSSEDISDLVQNKAVEIPKITMERQVSLAFWLAAAIFVVVLFLIASSKLHNTLAALSGAALLYAISYLGVPISENLFIFNFERSLAYIDWNVIFLIMGMMIVIAVIEDTGIFQWLAFFAYRVSGGRMWLLLPILMLITGIASAFLDNVTTMLLMTPITIQISIALGINPLALLIPEVMASNVIGVSTLVGTPTNILIGSFGDISFNDFLVNLTPGILLAFVGLIIYSSIIYKDELALAQESSELLLAKLAESAQITEPDHLKKAGIIGAGMLLLFITGESFHLLPAVTALIGATALLVWIQPDIEEMIEAVDWTTLVFFLSLFIVVGAIQEVGLISIIADMIGKLVGNSLLLAMIAVTWFSAVLSMVIANIPFTAAMLPVIGFLTTTVPGAESKALFFCLSVGAAMGGNGSLIGASANMVTAGIAESAGYSISYGYFLKKGFPALLITVGLALIWLLLKFG
jgi:Na+/H+ antiporter NhaD/arsenite permease-like protein